MVLAGFAVLFALVALGVYAAFHRALLALGSLGLAGAALTLYLLESVLVLIFVLALVSFVVSGLGLYYRARDTRFLLAAPLPLGALFWLRTIQTFALTSWTLVALGLPALIALGRVYERGPRFYAEGLAILASLAALSVGAGALLTMLTGAALRRAPSRLAAAAAVLALVVAFVVVVGRNVVPSAADFHAVFDPGMLNGKPASIKFIEAKFALWPSHPFAAALYESATRGRAGSTATRLALWLAPALLLAATATVGLRLFARTLPAIAEAFAFAPGGRRRGPARTPAFPRRWRGAVGALVERDLAMLVRSPHELGQAAFITVLLLVYTAFIVVAPLREVGGSPEAVARLLLFTIVAAGYFLTAFGLRFVFPAMSLEGRAAWVFFSSPAPVFRFLLAKAALSAGLLALVVVPIAMIGTLRLAESPAIVATTAALLLMVAATTTTILLGLGAAWPDFRRPSPEALSTTGAGLVATVSCLTYVAAVGWAARQAVLAAAAGESVVVWLASTAAVSVVLIGAVLEIARRRIPTLEAP